MIITSDTNLNKSYSMAGEDLLVRDIFKVIGETNRYCIEFGASDGYKHSNTRYFINNGWDFLLMDYMGGENGVKSEFITKDNINDLFEKYNVPKEVDFLSIDLDGNDYWVWEAIKLKPRVVCIEYNSSVGPDSNYIMKYDPNYSHDKTIPSKEFSASAKKIIELGKKKGYTAVYEIDYNNIIFIRNDCMVNNLPENPRLAHLISEGLKFLPNPNNIYK